MAVDIMDAGSEAAGVMMAGAVVGSTAVTDFMAAEGSAAVMGFKVEADSAAAQAAGFTVEVDSAAVQAEGFMVEADSTAVAGVTAADTAKLSSAENQLTIPTAGGICLRPFSFSRS
jgi:hypothetical protein